MAISTMLSILGQGFVITLEIFFLTLIGSLGFYMATGWQHLFFILLTAGSTWLVGLAIR